MGNEQKILKSDVKSMDIYAEIEKLVEYSVKNGFVNEEDRILITNLIAGAIELDTYREFSGFDEFKNNGSNRTENFRSEKRILG